MRGDMNDVRDIHIGSHLQAWNKRVEVEDIMGDLIGCALPNGGYEQYMLADLDPIPITETLLGELGFEKHIGSVVYDYVKDNEVFATELSDNRYRFEISTPDCVNHGNIIARYLHELENFYYHVFGKELVEG